LTSELGPSARGLAVDLSKPEAARDLMDRADPVDVLVADLVKISEAELQEAISINLLAPAALAPTALPPMIERGEGHIVLISSVAGLTATLGAGSVYTATNWGLRGLGLALRREVHGTGVGISTIFPGPIRDAGMFARTGVAMPWGGGTSSPEDVPRAVARAIERDRPETTVATGAARLSAALGGVAPVFVGTLARLAGARRVREEMIASHTQGDGMRTK
jgi:short-subunit dehydrogenase